MAALHISRVTLYRLMVAHGMRDPVDTAAYDGDDDDDAAKEQRGEESV